MLKNQIVRSVLLLTVFATVILFAIHIANNQLTTRHGVVRANIIDITPQVSGEIKAVYVTNNQAVTQGELLFEIDPADYQLQLQNAEANLAKIQQQLKELDANILVARAQVASEETKGGYAQLQYQRMNQLRGKNYISASDYDQAQSNFSVSQSAISSAKAQLEQAIAQRGMLGADNAQLRSAEVAIAQAKLNLERTRIYAPVSGRVGKVNIHVGDFAHSGSAALAVVDLQHLWIEGAFPETLVDQIKVGDRADVYLMANKSQKLSGHVTSIGSAINPQELPQSSELVAQLPQVFDWVRLAENVPVNITLDHPPADAILIPGLSATIDINP